MATGKNSKSKAPAGNKAARRPSDGPISSAATYARSNSSSGGSSTVQILDGGRVRTLRMPSVKGNIPSGEIAAAVAAVVATHKPSRRATS